MSHCELSVPNDTAHLLKVRKSVLELLQSGAGVLSGKETQMIALAVDEALANVMEHAYTEDDPKSKIGITLIMDLDDTRLEVVIRDAGQRFDPTSIGEVDIRDHVRQGKKGGLGIFLMRKIMDEVNYSYKRGMHNELQMIKYFVKPS